MFNWILDKVRTEQIRILTNKLDFANRQVEAVWSKERKVNDFWYRMYIQEQQTRLKLVRVYEEKKVKYNALQGRYQSKADRLRNLEEKTACFGGMMRLLNFREQCIKDACAILAKEPIESAPGVETAASKAYRILWRLPSEK